MHLNRVKVSVDQSNFEQKDYAGFNRSKACEQADFRANRRAAQLD
jgi:hypothetical protein